MKKILLVDDEALIRAIVIKVLGRAGYTLIEADNGAGALRAGAEHSGSIDLLLSDLQLPDIQGTEVFERLKGNNPNMKVLFMSGFAEGDSGTGTPVGGNFLQKPFSLTDLENAVAEALQ